MLIRPVRSADTSLLADGFARLSAASRQMRFLSVKKELSTADLRYFTDVDHHDHEALAALDQAAGHGVGIARYIRDAGEYTYTIELTGAEKIDDEHYTAINHLEGDFPGGVVDLHFRFTLRDGRIARLVIGLAARHRADRRGGTCRLSSRSPRQRNCCLTVDA